MIIDNNTPTVKYTPKNNPGIIDNKNNYKSGQRKLLAIEILFLTKYSHLSDTVLYVGSSPGHHINTLIDLFSNIKKWIFYDINDTKIDDTKIDDTKIDIHKEKFTIEHTKKYSNSNILFISDIRSYESLDMKGKIPTELADKTIKEDMDSQKDWVINGNFIMSLLKFRLTWELEKETEYFDGILHTQPWTGEYSPELRLITDGKKYKIYNNKTIDNQMYWYNTVKRLEIYDFLKEKKYEQFDYDQFLEYNIVKDYLINIQKKDAKFIKAFILNKCCYYKAKYRN